MSASRYEAELEKLAETYENGLAEDVERLKVAIAGTSDSSLIGVGSGGSFTTASLLCTFHETYTGRVSRPATPLEVISNPTLASASPVFLISAEGKNPDIVEALVRARRHSARAVHVLTNRRDSPLVARANELSGVNEHIFELKEKDGYLATNSLLLDAVLLARAYGELDRDRAHLPPTLDALTLGSTSIAEWLDGSTEFIQQLVIRGNVIVVFSPLLRAVAADLESKLSEAALLHCQLTDIRSFAHGRHLWLAQREAECAILALVEPTLDGLWDSMQRLLPPAVPVATMRFHSSKPRDLLAGLVAQMRVVAAVGRLQDKDPGRPDVPAFGRELHYIDIPSLIPAPSEQDENRGIRSKYQALGALWPSIEKRASMRRALRSFEAALERQTFRAIVFDYDGTLCSSQRNNQPPTEQIATALVRLLGAGIVVGIASGRGGSVRENLQKCIPKDLWHGVVLGLYNGGSVSTLDASDESERTTSEFLAHVIRIVGRLKALGVPIETIRETHPYQVSIRFQEGVNAQGNWMVVADALRQEGLGSATVLHSKHSVDVLHPRVSKSLTVARLIRDFRVRPYEVLTMGDQGAWPGNDSSLLEHRFSLSVDIPSRRLDRGWNLAPGHMREVDAALWYLERIESVDRCSFRISFTERT